MSWLQDRSLHLAALALVVMLAYSNTFDVPLQFDDQRFVQKNPVAGDYRSFIDGLKAKSLSGHQDSDLPRFIRTRHFAFLSFWADNRIGGGEVRMYHVTNTLVHLANSWLVYWLLLLTLGVPRLGPSLLGKRAGEVALVTALLFAAHPLQTQAVTYISQRFASLATLWYLLSLVLYVSSRLRRQRRWQMWTCYLFSLLAAVAAMKTKEIAFTLPLAVAAYEFFFFEGPPGKRALRLAPFALTMLIIPLALLGGGVTGAVPDDDTLGATRMHTTTSRGEYALTQTLVVARYLRLLLFPVSQNLDHDIPIYNSIFSLPVLAAILLHLGLFLAACIAFRASGTRDPGWRLPAYGILWFFLTLSVESSLIPIRDVIFEHRVYLPSVGIFAAATAGVYLVLMRTRLRLAVPVATAVLLLTVVALAQATYLRNRVWQDEVSLWEDVVSKSPQRLRGHNNLGNAYLRQGRYGQAIEQYLLALQAEQTNWREYFDNAETHYNLGLAYAETHQTEKAVEQYRLALVLNPRNADAYNNLGVIYFDRGLLDEALKCYQQALALAPAQAHAYFNLGELHAKRGEHEKSIDSYRTYLRYRPDSAQAHLNIGLSYYAIGNQQRATEHFRQALDLKPGWEEAREHLKRSLAALGSLPLSP